MYFIKSELDAEYDPITVIFLFGRGKRNFIPVVKVKLDN